MFKVVHKIDMQNEKLDDVCKNFCFCINDNHSLMFASADEIL